MASTVMLMLMLLLAPLLTVIKVDGKGGLLFLESGPEQYFRSYEPKSDLEAVSFYQEDVAAAISVLLGVSPLITSSSSASKLDKLLSPNPFDRPRAVLSLNLGGLDPELLSARKAQEMIGKANYQLRVLESHVIQETFHLPGEDVILKPLGELGHDISIKDELTNLCSFLNVSFSKRESSTKVEMRVPLPNSEALVLDISKDADKKVCLELLSLFQGMQQALAVPIELPKGSQHPAELLMGTFSGIEALHEEYGSSPLTLQASELFLFTVVKIFNSLCMAYSDQIVGVFSLLETSTKDTGPPMFDVKFPIRSSQLSEISDSPTSASNATTPSVTKAIDKLVRYALAVTTAIILLVATVLGVCCLVGMPVTRDTLLYSGAKLD